LYEKDLPATWVQGDWTGDGRFESGDLVRALQETKYSFDALPKKHRSADVATIILDDLDRKAKKDFR
ncbi:MAG: hypothetical protein KDB27_25280, partial [Planctomycetales bacterium]|nr:hypothetical protein [Planctomycetales bacterium]